MNYKLLHYPVDIKNIVLRPESFDTGSHIYFVPTVAIEILESNINNRNIGKLFIDNYLDIVETLIYSQLTFRKTTSSKKLERIKNYKVIIDMLSPRLIIKKNNYSTALNRCIEYILDLETNNWSFVYINKNYIGIDTNRHIDNGLIHGHLCNNNNYLNSISNSEIDVLGAIRSEIIKYSSDKYELGLQSLKVKIAISKILSFCNMRFIKKGREVDRVFNSFSSLSKVSRKCITLNGNSFTEIDIRNSQPLLLLILLNKHGFIPDSNYTEDVLNGALYGRIKEKAKELGYSKEFIRTSDNIKYEILSFEDDEDVKQLLYRSVFFKLKNERLSLTSFVFKKLYPSVFEALKSKLNMGDKKNLAYHLQNLESDIVLNIIPKCAYYTVHDSIALIDESEVEPVKNAIISKINEYLGMNANINLRVTRLESPSENLSENTTAVDMSVLNIKGYKKSHVRKIVKYDKFKSMSGKFTRSEIILDLNISSKTYLRYLKEYHTELSII